MKMLKQTVRFFMVGALALFPGLGFSSGLYAAGEAERVYTATDVKITDAQRRAAETFYRGKTIDWVIYIDPGSSTGVMLRLIQKYLPKYIPGNPRSGSTQVQAGGGGLLAPNYVYNRSPRDGTEIGQFGGVTHRNPLFRPESVRYELTKFTWIANFLPQNYRLILTRKGIGLDTIDQLMKAGKIHMATFEVGHNFYNEMRLGMYLLGIKFNIIPAYSDAEAALAIERGEIEGKVEAAETFLTNRRHWLEQGKVVIQWQSEPTRFPKLPDVPTIFELAQKHAKPPLGPKDHALMQMNVDLGRYARYLGMPPGVPLERALAVQEAVGKMIEDKEFYAEFSKLTGFEPEFTPGHILLQAFQRLLDQPKEIVALWTRLAGPEPLPKR